MDENQAQIYWTFQESLAVCKGWTSDLSDEGTDNSGWVHRWPISACSEGTL